MTVFLDDQDYRQFVHVLGEVVADFDLRCWNYCVMPNHYHVTVQPTRANLSEAVRRLNSVYAQWWNKRHGRVGHVFQGRFKDQIVDREAYLHALTRYVVMNPVRAHLVRQPEEWAWSSYRATVGFSAPPAFLSGSLTLSLFGDGDASTLQWRFINSLAGHLEDQALVDRIRSNERILGDLTFKKLVQSSAEPADGGVV